MLLVSRISLYRRLAKSALVLIPLFGVPYMLFLGAQYYYIDGKLELAKLYFEMTFNSFNVSRPTLKYNFVYSLHFIKTRPRCEIPMTDTMCGLGANFTMVFVR